MTIPLQAIKESILSVLAKAQSIKESKCLEELIKDFSTEDAYLTKLLYDSGKNKNDIGSPKDCFGIQYSEKYNMEVFKRLDYIVLFIDNSESNDTNITVTKNKDNSLIGICTPNGGGNCAIEEYFQIVRVVNEDYPSLLDDIKDMNQVNIYRLKGTNKNITYLANCIPIGLYLIFFSFSFLTILPVWLFYLFLHNRISDYSIKITSCFNFTENSFEIMTNKNKEKNFVTNETGISFLRGLRGLATIFYIIGETFKQLYVNPMKTFVTEIFKSLLKSFSFLVVLFGLRFCSGIFYAISSFSLTFKLLNFLDSEIEKTEDDEEDLADESRSISMQIQSFTGGINDISSFTTPLDMDSENINDLDFNQDTYEKGKKKLKLKALMVFMFRQSFKYFMFVFAVFYFKFSIYEPLAVFTEPGPIWNYFKTMILDKFQAKHIVANLFLYTAYSSKTFYQNDPFCLVYNEITMFIILSCLIYISYKKSLRLDLIVIFLFFIIQGSKCLLYTLLHWFNSKEGFKFYPLITFKSIKANYILSNPIYNLPNGLIGVFFGLIQYAIQKSESHQTTKGFLKIPIRFVHLFTHNAILRFLIGLFSLIMIGLIFFEFQLFILGFEYDEYDNVLTHFWLNLIGTFDVQFAIFFIFLFTVVCFLKGDSKVISILQHEFWNIFSKTYFSFLISCQGIIYLVFFQSESRVKIQMFNIIFFSVLIILLCLVFNVINFIFVEIPLKKLNKLITLGTKSKKSKKKL